MLPISEPRAELELVWGECPTLSEENTIANGSRTPIVYPLGGALRLT